MCADPNRPNCYHSSAWYKRHPEVPRPAPAFKEPKTKERTNDGGLTKGDAFGLIGLILFLVGYVIAFPFSIRLLFLFLGTLGCFFLMRESPWTRQWPRWSQYGSASVLAVVILLIAAPQVRSQWRTEHPNREATNKPNELSPTPSTPQVGIEQSNASPTNAASPATRQKTGKRKPSTATSSAFAVRNANGPFKIVNSYIETNGTGVQCLKGNCGDLEVRENQLQTNSIVQNGGKTGGVLMEDNIVHAPANGTATLLQNLPGGETGDVIARKNEVFGANWWDDEMSSVIAGSGDRPKILELVTTIRQECEKRWEHISPTVREKYEAELEPILKRIVEFADDEKPIEQDLHRAPSFLTAPQEYPK